MRILRYISRFSLRTIYLKYVLSIFVGTIACVASGQNHVPTPQTFRHLTVADGLSSNHAICMHQDEHGFMWIGTSEGLSRFDGVHFQNYFHHPDDPQHSLSGNLVNAIFPYDKKLFISTNHGISVFDLVKNEFHNEIITNERLNYRSEELFNFIVFDGSDWYAGGEKSLLRLQADFSLSHDISADIAASNGPRMRDFLPPVSHHPGVYYFAACGDLVSYDAQQRKFQRADILSESVVMASPGMCHTSPPLVHGKSVYFFTWAANPWRYDIEHKDPLPATIILAQPNPVYDGSVIHTEIAVDESVWIAAENGVFRMDATGNVVSEIKLDGDVQAKYACYYISFDNHNRPWIATDRGVFYSLDTNENWDLIALPQNADTREVIAQDLVYWNEEVWCNSSVSAVKEIYLLSGEGAEAVQVSGLSDGVRSLFPWDEKTLMVGGWKGSVMFDKANRTFAENLILPEKFRDLPIVKTLKDGHGFVWFSFGHSLGMVRCNLATGEYVHFVNQAELESDQRFCPIGSAIDMAEDASGNIWMVRSKLDGKLMKWNAGSDVFEEIHPINAEAQNMHFNGESYSIAVRDNIVWFGVMREGLFRYDITNNTLSQYTRNDGLISNDIMAIELDHHGVVWMGTTQGLAAFQFGEKKFAHFTTAEGLPSADFGSASAFDPVRRRLYFSCPGFVVSFDPELLLKSPSFPGVYLTGIKVEGQYKGIVYNDFQPGENHIDFFFTAVDMKYGPQVEYRYKLEGLESEWNDAGKNNMASYANIPAGNYVLLVSVKLNGEWSEPVQVYTFNLPQFFYKTWWFMILCIVAFCCLVYGVYVFRVRRIKQLEAIRNRISRDLHDDIGSALSSIRILSGNVKSDAGSQQDVLKRINRSSQQMLDNMDDIIWAIQPDNDTGEQLLIRMREYASEVLEAAGIEYDIQFDERMETRHVSIDHKRNVYLIFKEAVNNAVKYSGARQVNLNFISVGSEKARLEVLDDGSGYDSSTVKFGNGILNMQKRAGEMNASLRMDSAPGKGTRIQLDFTWE